ncbi:cellulose synthase subunit BcsC-related outer membrane protein, partial [Roseateles sp. GG27B]
GSPAVELPTTQTAKGIGAAISYSREGLTVDAGMTPTGFIYKDITAGVKVNGALKDDGSLTYRVNLSRRPVTDSLLSFAGASDAATGKIWGGIMASGARLDLTQDLNGYGVTGSAAWHRLSGHGVASNGRNELGLGGYATLLSKANSQLSTGMNFSSLTYQKNLGDFSYGQGGYFSPQRYRSLTVPLNWSQRAGAVNFLLQGALGYQQFSQDVTGTALTGASSQSSSGIAYKVAASAQFQLAPQWLLDANLESDNSASGSFHQWGAGLNLRYSFHPNSQAQPLLFSSAVAPFGQ